MAFKLVETSCAGEVRLWRLLVPTPQDWWPVLL